CCDFPGSAHSTRPPPPDYSLDLMARALDVILTFLGPRPVVLVGHSIGGMVLLTLCTLLPAPPGGGHGAGPHDLHKSGPDDRQAPALYRPAKTRAGAPPASGDLALARA